MSQIVLFARGLIALLDLWPALTIAVREQWGGPDSAEKKVWMASVVVDEFEARAVFLPAADPPLDADELADWLAQMMSDEFDASVEDDSLAPLAADVLRLWRDVVAPGSSAAAAPPALAVGLAPATRTAEETVAALERQAAGQGAVRATSGGGPDEVDGDGSGSDWDSGSEDGEAAPAAASAPAVRRADAMDVDAEDAPELVPREPEVDEDGFTTVRKGRRR